nr:leucine-rich repeat domain-containing protein [Maliibacterium massiliense]
MNRTTRAMRVLAIIVLAAMLLGVAGCQSVSAALEGKTRVRWREQAIGDAVAQALGKKYVFFEDLDDVKELTVQSQTPIDIGEVAALPALEKLDLSACKVTDYSVLMAAPKLQTLYVGGDADYAQHIDALGMLQASIPVNDIDTDANYWSKQAVRFFEPAVENAVRAALQKPVGQLTMAETRALRQLKLENVSFASLADLVQCPQLYELTISGCSLTDLQVVTPLTGLLYLNVDNNQITDISAITALAHLQVFSAADNQIRDIAPLRALSALRGVSLNNNPVENHAVLAELTGLEQLGLAHNGLEQVDFLAGLTQLKMLWLDNNRLADLAPLAGLTRLEVLSVGGNRLTSLAPIAPLTGLQKLYAPANNLWDMSEIAHLTNLDTLSLTLNNVMDVRPIAALPKLVSLDIFSNPVVDFAPLADLNRQWAHIDVDLNLARQATDKARQVAKVLLKAGMTDGEKVRAAHDYVCRNTRYDHAAADAGALGYETQSLYASMIRGEAVCVGYAEGVAVLCANMGVAAAVVTGTGDGVAHAWNLVYIDGQPRYVDATWDDPDHGSVIYRDYLLVDAEAFRQGHTWDEELYLRARVRLPQEQAA